MFLLVNTKTTNQSNKRLVYNITNLDSKESILKGILDGDTVELTLTENYSNSSHKLVASYNSFVNKVPYSFTLVDAIGISSIQTLKSTIDFKITDVKIIQYSDPTRPNNRHYIAVQGENGRELVEVSPLAKVEHGLKRETYYTTPDGKKIKVTEPCKFTKDGTVINGVLKARVIDNVDELEFILPAGGAIVPIISTDQLLTKSYLRKKLGELVTVNRLDDAFRDALDKKIVEAEKIVKSKVDAAIVKLLDDKVKLDAIADLIYNRIVHKVEHPKPFCPERPHHGEELVFKDDPREYYKLLTSYPSGNHPEGLLPDEIVNSMLDPHCSQKHHTLLWDEYLCDPTDWVDKPHKPIKKQHCGCLHNDDIRINPIDDEFEDLLNDTCGVSVDDGDLENGIIGHESDEIVSESDGGIIDIPSDLELDQDDEIVVPEVGDISISNEDELVDGDGGIIKL